MGHLWHHGRLGFYQTCLRQQEVSKSGPCASLAPNTVNTKAQPDVPGIGYGSFPVLRQWRGAVRFMLDPAKHMTEGCNKYSKSYFKVSTLQDEYLVVSQKEKIKEVSYPRLWRSALL